MAKQGNNAAYQQLRSPQDNITNDIRYWNEDAAARREEDRVNANDAFIKKEKAEKEKQDRYDKYVKPLNNYDTGSQSLNEVQGRLIQNAVEEYPTLLSVLENPSSSREEKLKAQLKLQNINNLPANLKTFTDFYTAQNESYTKDVESGLIYKDDNYEKAFKGGFSNMQLGLDDKGMPVVGFVDLDGDGIADKPSGKLIDFQSYDQIQKGIPTFDFQKKFNFEGAISNVAEKLGTVDNSTETGVTTIQTKGVDEDALGMITDKLFGDPVKLSSALRDYGLENTPENIAKIKDDFNKAVIAETDKLYKKNVDQTALNQIRDDKREQDKLNKKTTITNSEGVEISEGTWASGYYKNIDRSKVVSKPGNGIVLEAPKDNKNKVYDNSKVLNYTFDKYGSLLLDVEYEGDNVTTTKQLGTYEGESVSTKQDKPTKRKVIQVTKEDAREFASKMGMTVSELKKSVQKGTSTDGKKEDTNEDPLGIL